jgi:thiol-disulfide isomerase/thioredoxin
VTRTAGVGAAALLVWALAACDAGGAAGREPGVVVASPPFADCALLRAAPAAAAPAAAGPAPNPAPNPAPSGAQGGEAPSPATLPALELPCYTGGAGVPLGRLRGPAVLNVWASTCAPCREELPVFQRFAERTAGRVHVVGVVSGDTRSRSTSLAQDLGLSFPQLDDPDGRLMRALRRVALPATLFVDGDGRVRHFHTAGAVDAATLDGLARRHLGVPPS